MASVQPLTIDGSQGEGGGQILRTALSLAACGGRPVEVCNVRAGREKPGLMRQHLAVVRALAEVTQGQVEGDALGSQRVWFAPGAPRAGRYRFAIGSAGSTTLLWQALLPALLAAPGASAVVLEGGTHAAMAPTFDFLQHSVAPILARMGVGMTLQLQRHGFYPNGGGIWQAQVQPWQAPRSLELLERGAPRSRQAFAMLGGLPARIARRELNRVQAKLGWPAEALQVQTVESIGPGNCLSLRVAFDHVTEVVDTHGRLGLSAERVAGTGIRQLRRYLAMDAPVGAHLADQLLVPMVLGAGGQFRCLALTPHTRTNVAVIRQFYGANCIAINERANDAIITVAGRCDGDGDSEGTG